MAHLNYFPTKVELQVSTSASSLLPLLVVGVDIVQNANCKMLPRNIDGEMNMQNCGYSRKYAKLRWWRHAPRLTATAVATGVSNDDILTMPAHTRTVTFRRYKLYDAWNKWVLSPFVNCFKVSVSSRRWQGREFHSVGPAKQNARGPYIDNLCRVTFISVLSADRRWLR